MLTLQVRVPRPCRSTWGNRAEAPPGSLVSRALFLNVGRRHLHFHHHWGRWKLSGQTARKGSERQLGSWFLDLQILRDPPFSYRTCGQRLILSEPECPRLGREAAQLLSVSPCPEIPPRTTPRQNSPSPTALEHPGIQGQLAHCPQGRGQVFPACHRHRFGSHRDRESPIVLLFSF